MFLMTDGVPNYESVSRTVWEDCGGYIIKQVQSGLGGHKITYGVWQTDWKLKEANYLIQDGNIEPDDKYNGPQNTTENPKNPQNGHQYGEKQENVIKSTFHIIGSGNDYVGQGYIEAMGDLIKDYKVGTNEAIDSYVVGFSAVPDDLLSIDETAETINAKETFIAQTSEELEDSFNELLIDAMNKSIQIIR